jgi:hypothetical protein
MEWIENGWDWFLRLDVGAKAGVVSVVIGGLALLWSIYTHFSNHKTANSRQPEVKDLGANVVSTSEISPLSDITEELRKAGYAWLTIVSDSIGNRNMNSWGKGQGGAWSHAKCTTVHVGDAIALYASAVSPTKDQLEFKFSIQRSGRSFFTQQDWGTQSDWIWNVDRKDIGSNIIVMIAVRQLKEYYQFNDADDYTYAIYNVLPR